MRSISRACRSRADAASCAAREPEQALRGRELALQLVVAARDLRLALQVLELLVELLADVVHAQQVLARVLQPQLGLAAPLAVLGNARGFFEEDAQLLGLRLDHARDHALLDDRVGARAQSRAEEDVGDVAPAHVDVVDVVATSRRRAASTRLIEISAYCDHCPAALAEAVVEDELDARAVYRLALPGAVEEHVLHGFAAQVLGGGFAEHPAHGVDDVRFAAAVGPDDADELARGGNASGIDEGLETGEVDLREAHFDPLPFIIA